MIDLLKDVQSPAGSFGFVFSFLALAGWLIYYITKKVTQINSDHSVLTDNISKTNAYIDEIRRDLSYLKGNIDIITMKNNPLRKKKSPISLTDKGLAISQQIRAKEIIDRNWERIYENLEKNICDKNAYDIQGYCLTTPSVNPEKFFGDDDIRNIKEFAFSQGNPLHIYMQMMGIIIRDRYLKMKGIDVNEIDRNDPNR
ncbi:MAG: hypothetical protein LBG15_08080 [Dysgonamonadaceae bacterium]|jgi:hypothetical protein|nr:hypothetical protein [Dysgonamonadaceae bacterium]